MLTRKSNHGCGSFLAAVLPSAASAYLFSSHSPSSSILHFFFVAYFASMVTVFSSVLETLYAARYHILTLFLGTIAWQQWASYRQLAAFKGPHLARFTNLWMAKAVASKEQHLKLFEVYEKYGELARIGPNTLLTSDPELLQRMSSARSGYTRSDWYSGQKLEVDQDNLFSVLDEKIHTRRRAQMAPGVSTFAENHIIALTSVPVHRQRNCRSRGSRR
jgi:hypothetical protein